MAQKRSMVSLALFLLFGATTAPLFAMEPAEKPSEQPMDQAEQLMNQFTPVTPRDIRQAEQNRQRIAVTDKRVAEMLARTNNVMQEADEYIKQGNRALNQSTQRSASPEFPTISTMDKDLADYLKIEKVDTNIFGDEALLDEVASDSDPIQVIVEETAFPAQPRFIPVCAYSVYAQNAGPQEEPSIPAGPTIPAQPQENPAPAPVIEDDSRPQLYDDINYYQTATAGQGAIPGNEPQPLPQPRHPAPIEQPKQPAPVQQTQQLPPVTHKIEESMLKQILGNIMDHKVPMATAGAFGVVHYLYENEILANAVPVRSRQMCIFLHDYILPTTREALAANLIQLLLPYLPYLRDKGVRSYSSGTYLASFVTTKLLGTTALYLAKLVTQTEQGKKLLTQYKRLPKNTIETIEKVMPWINFARNVFVARSLAGYFE